MKQKDNKRIQKKQEEPIGLFYIKPLLNSDYDIDEIVINPKQIEEDIQKTIEYIEWALENQNASYFDDPVHIKEFFENFIRLFYLRNELSPYLVCINQKEYVNIFQKGGCFCITPEAFVKFPKEHKFNRLLDDQCQIFIPKQVELNVNPNPPVDEENKEETKKNPKLPFHLLRKMVFADFPRDIKIDKTMTFEEYIHKIGLISIAQLEEDFDQMITYQSDLKLKYYSLVKIRDTPGSKNHIYKNDTAFLNAVTPYITNCPLYTSKRATDRSKKYLVFQSYGHLSAKQVYEYFYQLYLYIFRVFYIKIIYQCRLNRSFQSKLDYLPENLIQEMSLGYGYDLYLDYDSRHWKGEKKKAASKFNQSLTAFVNTSFYYCIRNKKLKIEHDEEKNNTMVSDEDHDEGDVKYSDFQGGDLEYSESSAGNLQNIENQFSDNKNITVNDVGNFEQITGSKKSKNQWDDNLKDFFASKGIKSKYVMQLYKEYAGFVKKHLHLIKQSEEDHLQNIPFSFENHYLKTLSFMNKSIIEKMEGKDIESLDAMNSYYMLTFIHDFYEELTSQKYCQLKSEYETIKDKSQKKEKKMEIIRVLKGQLWHLNYLIYCIKLVNIGNHDDERKLTQKAFKELIQEKLKQAPSKEEYIRQLYSYTFHYLKYNYVPMLDESPYFKDVWDEKIKSNIEDYLDILQQDIQSFYNDKDLYKLAFGNSDTPHNISRFIFHVYQIKNIYMDILVSNHWLKVIENINMEVEKNEADINA